MVSSRLVRRTAVVVCAGGIAGMIVSSILNHNGAAITFGLVTATAVLCSMVATAVAADVTRQLTAAPARVGPGTSAPAEAPTGTSPTVASPAVAGTAGTGPAGTGPAGTDPAAPGPAAPRPAGTGPTGTSPTETAVRTPPASSEHAVAGRTDEEQAALVETLVEGLVRSGADESAARELVRQSVRLGRILAAR